MPAQDRSRIIGDLFDKRLMPMSRSCINTNALLPAHIVFVLIDTTLPIPSVF
ncbi:hypothetical protein SISNIDRAFT_450335 [Sistotremastrum niveocremeum HHB9708]|uniref:Uncharacterized protein n=1 Tax=Sistotremastrum niveocremeum HHB9708 TaxID=1314777 RepID=A0A164Y6K9_9AGAM|nr:hypothetical protein SISNIDRAFT_450335 [Sistotremastrum niveocremeum HHB9708]